MQLDTKLPAPRPFRTPSSSWNYLTPRKGPKTAPEEPTGLQKSAMRLFSQLTPSTVTFLRSSCASSRALQNPGCPRFPQYFLKQAFRLRCRVPVTPHRVCLFFKSNYCVSSVCHTVLKAENTTAVQKKIPQPYMSPFSYHMAGYFPNSPHKQIRAAGRKGCIVGALGAAGK